MICSCATAALAARVACCGVYTCAGSSSAAAAQPKQLLKDAERCQLLGTRGCAPFMAVHLWLHQARLGARGTADGMCLGRVCRLVTTCTNLDAPDLIRSSLDGCGFRHS
jgi:hypothetical protein